MFESMTDRIAGTLLMGLDVAVEFATLGEFRLVEAGASPAPDVFQAAPLGRLPPPPQTVSRPHRSCAGPHAARQSSPTACCCRRHPRRSRVPPPSRQHA